MEKDSIIDEVKNRTLKPTNFIFKAVLPCDDVAVAVVINSIGTVYGSIDEALSKIPQSKQDIASKYIWLCDELESALKAVISSGLTADPGTVFKLADKRYIIDHYEYKRTITNNFICYVFFVTRF